MKGFAQGKKKEEERRLASKLLEYSALSFN